MTHRYRSELRALLSPRERAVFEKLSTPQKIQTYLESLPFNFEESGETQMSPRRSLQTHRAHCFEGALFAATALAYHGRAPMLLDIKAAPGDHDHVVALFKVGNLWGAISKTNHAVLRYRDPVYKSVRELAMSYFHEYFLNSNGKKTMRAYSAPFNLTHYKPERWVVATDELDWLGAALDDSRHFPIAPQKNMRELRPAVRIEREAGSIVERKLKGK